MNKYKDKSSLTVMSDPNDERIGAALSRELAGIAESEPAPCPGAEEIAAVVEGAAPARVNDRLLKHISTCADCYESFLLTVELHKKAEEERKEDKHKIIYLRPLALAASVLIVVFTAYLVFRTGGIPQTPGDLEKSVTLEESSETRPRLSVTLPREQPAAAPESDAERMEEDKKDKKEEIKADNNLDRFSKPAPPPPSPSPSPSLEKPRMAKAKTFETTKSTAPGSPEPLKEVPKEAEEAKKGEPALGVTAQIQRANDETAGKPSLSYMDRQDSGEIGKKGAPAPLQQQAIILNQQVREINTYVPQKELEDLFNQTIDLSRQMVKEVQALNKEAAVSRDFNKMNAYIDGLKPMIKVTVEADAVYIFPDVQWFFSRSDPASVEYRFFSLARSGWCVADDLCTIGKHGWAEAQKLLAQWQELEPQLTGIFKQIAARTISRLTAGSE